MNEGIDLTNSRGGAFKGLPRCQAKAKHSGEQCGQVAMKGKRVCWLHGGRGGARKGNRNAKKHGGYSDEIQEERKRLAELLERVRPCIDEDGCPI